MAIGDNLRAMFSNVKNRFVSIGDRLKNRVKDAGKTIGTIIERMPTEFEKALGFVAKQAVTVGKTVGKIGYEITSQTGKGISGTVTDTLTGSFFSGPVILGGLGLGAFLAYKTL